MDHAFFTEQWDVGPVRRRAFSEVDERRWRTLHLYSPATMRSPPQATL